MLRIDCGPWDGNRRPVAIVGAVHGDEPCGARAIHAILSCEPKFQRPVRFIIANEQALRRNERCVDVDLNRAAPGSLTADAHERRLAAKLRPLIRHCETVTLHSTNAKPTPFALVQQWTPTTKALVQATGVENAANISYVDGGLEESLDGIAVECGPIGSNAAARKTRDIVTRVLTARGVLNGSVTLSDPDVYEIFDTVDGEDLVFEATNFKRVSSGERFARVQQRNSPDAIACSTPGQAIIAEKAFYPVMMATDGYDEMLGFQSKHIGSLSDVDVSDAPNA